MANSENGDLGFSLMQKKDCFFFVQYGRCSYGQSCRYNHPSLDQDSEVVQEVRTENSYANYRMNIPCKFYHAGFCKYGMYCDFNHSMPHPLLQYNSDGLPMRLGVAVCSFYMGNLWCGYGASCKFHHPQLQFAIPQEYGSHDSGEALQYTIHQEYGSSDSGLAQEYDGGLVGTSDGGSLPICATSSPHQMSDNGN